MEIKIGNRLVGDNHPVFIVAEMSANHLKNLEIAKKIIFEAKNAGADAIKLQTYTPDTITLKADTDLLKISQGTIWDGKTFYDLYTEAYTPWEWHEELKNIAEKEGLIFFSTPFDKSAVDFLEDLNVPAYKIASFEITDIPLIEYTASKIKPIILSTGVATISDIEEALAACKNAGNSQIVLLKCTSAYPTPLSEVNLFTIPDFRMKFGVIPGLSDHTKATSVPVGAVALGAKIIEKHLMLDRSLGGPDAAFSLEPHEFREMVKNVREIEQALGTVSYVLDEEIIKTREFTRSLFVVKDIEKGEPFTEKNIRSVRPGYGLHPRFFNTILGKVAKRSIKKGTPLDWDMILSDNDSRL